MYRVEKGYRFGTRDTFVPSSKYILLYPPITSVTMYQCTLQSTLKSRKKTEVEEGFINLLQKSPLVASDANIDTTIAIHERLIVNAEEHPPRFETSPSVTQTQLVPLLRDSQAPPGAV